MRRLNLVVTIGGGFLGFAFTLQAFFSAQESNPVYYAAVIFFVILYGYGIFVGLRLVEHPPERKHLLRYYWLQLPWISSPFIAYRFTSGFHFSIAIGTFGIRWLFRIGSDWQSSLFHSEPWGLGVNVFALLMVILLSRPKKFTPQTEETPLNPKNPSSLSSTPPLLG